MLGLLLNRLTWGKTQFCVYQPPHANECGGKKSHKFAARSLLKFWTIIFKWQFNLDKNLLCIPNPFTCYLFQMALSQFLSPQTTNTSSDSYSQLITLSEVTEKAETIRASIYSECHASLPTYLSKFPHFLSSLLT